MRPGHGAARTLRVIALAVPIDPAKRHLQRNALLRPPADFLERRPHDHRVRRADDDPLPDIPEKVIILSDGRFLPDGSIDIFPTRSEAHLVTYTIGVTIGFGGPR